LIERLSIAGAVPPQGAYSPAVRAGDFLLISGQIPLDPMTGNWDHGDLEHETRRVLANLDLLLAEVSATREQIVKCVVFLADGRDFAAMNEIYAEYFGSVKPARSTVEAVFRNPRMKIEIEAVVYAPPSGKDPLMIERITPPGCPVPHGPYSPAVRAGDFIYVSGQAAVDPVTQAWSFGDVQHETRRTLENIKLILAGCGAEMADVVKCTVFLKDGRDFAAMNEIYAEFFGQSKPARSTVEVRFANADMKIEIEAVAYKPRS
jgi:2-iminobutanoate/2-iminopropanoate deaminase